MRALLVQSPATSPWVPRRQWEPPSVAMATIAGQIDNHDVRVADMVVWRKQAVPRFLKLLREFKPDVVGFTSMTFQYDTTVGFAYLTKQFDSRIRTVLGGYHATLFSESIAAGPDAGFWDFLMRGEGDFAFGELLDSIEAAWQGDGKHPWTFLQGRWRLPPQSGASARRSDQNPDSCPRQADYQGISTCTFRRADVIETSRGCLHHCNFCSIHEMYGSSIRQFPLERVLADIEDAYSRGARHLFCTDDNITLEHGSLRAAHRRRHQSKAEKPDVHHPGEPDRFRTAPARRQEKGPRPVLSIFLGIENASTKNLRTMKKPNTLDTIQRGGRPAEGKHRRHRRHHQWASHDDPESIRENYQFIKKHGDYQRHGPDHDAVSQDPLARRNASAGRVANLSDFRWYDGYFSNVRTRPLYRPRNSILHAGKSAGRSSACGVPTKADWKYFKGYTYVWEFGLRHIVWLNERMLEFIIWHRRPLQAADAAVPATE
jgi:anaerobic magnesium-protoporphyrin IX monomethyl ester cyclase